MKTINFISNIAMPMVILLIVIYGLKEKNKVFDTFPEIALLLLVRKGRKSKNLRGEIPPQGAA